ncbi:hypothetical protein [Rothia halotolerans]|uniref:hypothetical protein n=1 Tax=Rothia halotolerans TaxID=405770 RepID=UPI0013EC4380|nr:hypothetical protein [Rothia halotolerans]
MTHLQGLVSRIRLAWFNGASGAGKTAAARLLAESVPGSGVRDPEITVPCRRWPAAPAR